MTFGADGRPQDAPVTQTGIGGSMHLVTVYAGNRFVTVDDHVADIAVDMTVTRVEIRIISFRKIDFEILKEIVSRDESIRIWKPRRSGFRASQVALSAK